MPIAAVIGNRIFCVHGGLSPDMQSMEEITALSRPSEVPEFGLLNDLLWSDPSDLSPNWSENDRGVSVCFGRNNINNFLQKFDLDLICRAHMVNIIISLSSFLDQLLTSKIGSGRWV